MTNVLLITACLLTPAFNNWEGEAPAEPQLPGAAESSLAAQRKLRPPVHKLAKEHSPAQDGSESGGADAVTSSVATIAENLRAADRGLMSGQTGSATLTAQQNAIDQLAKLIEAAESARAQAGSAGQQNAAAAQQRAAAGASTADDASGAQQDPQGGTAGQSSEKASSSDERAAVPAGSQNALELFRENVVRDAWGHLPPRLRDQLLNAGSEKYLPKYDDLVRDYFESLAKPHHSEGSDGKR